MNQEYIPNNLPLKKDIETKKILKKTILSNKALAKLNGVAKIIPNSNILINSLALQEAKDSSELYKASLDIKNLSHATKEVQNYKNALLKGFSLVSDNKLLLKKYIVEIQNI